MAPAIKRPISSTRDMSVEDAWEFLKSSIIPVLRRSKSVVQAAWSRTTRRVRGGLVLATCFLITLLLSHPNIPSSSSLPSLPSISIFPSHSSSSSPFSPSHPDAHRYNISKVALLIENRATPPLAPLLLHFISVVPPDWRFRFMGSFESVAHVNTSRAIRDAVKEGKLDLTYIPANMTTGSQEEISQFLTNLWIYETVLVPAEWLLVFQTDSMLCANSRQSLNNFLEYDWVGAPWNPKGRFGGNGGLSLRRVSAIIDVLKNQNRPIGDQPEDVWLTDRLGHRPNAKVANGTVSLIFSGEQHVGSLEHLSGTRKKPGQDHQVIDNSLGNGLVKGIDDWRDGFYEPMGYHIGGGGAYLHSKVWGSKELRKHIYGYCPEVKIMLQGRMDAERFVPGDCKGKWKRETEDGEERNMEGLDGEEYPLPAGLMPW